MALVALALVASACSRSSGPSDEPTVAPPRPTVAVVEPVQPLVLGALLPANDPVGEPLIAAVDMAVRDINAAGGVMGVEVVLARADSGADPDVADLAIDRLIIDDGVAAIVGPAAPEVTRQILADVTAAPILQCAPADTPSELGADLQDGFYFRTSPADDLQGEALAGIVSDFDHNRVAIVSRSDEYGEGLQESFVRAFEDGGGQIVFNETYSPSTNDFSELVSGVASAGADAVVVVGLAEGVDILEGLVAEGIGPDRVPTYISDGVGVAELGRLIDFEEPGIAEGVVGTRPAVAPSSAAEFFSEAFATFAPGVNTDYAAQAYDCAIILALATHAASSIDPAEIKEHVVDVTRGGERCETYASCLALLDAGADIDYEGASGSIDLKRGGEPSVGIYDVYEYDDRGLQVVVDELRFG